MKLQAALDVKTLDDALRLMEIIHDYVDIAEIGTPLVVAEGVRAVKVMKEKYPNIDVLCDAKIMDGGRSIARMAFAAGADIVTVLGITNDSTVRGAVEAAREYGKKVCADTIGIRADDLAKRTRELEEMGVDYIAVHTAHDMLDCIATPIEALKVIKDNISKKDTYSVISGGIKPEAMPEIKEVGPDVVIVGSGICKSDDPLKVVQELKAIMNN